MARSELDLPKESRALVVAHPDDETLWFGGLLVAHPGDWTVICCSIPRRDAVRAHKFFAACERLGARGSLLPWTETEADCELTNLEHLELAHFGCVVTHNARGEYGHLHHRHVHRHVAATYRGPLLVSGYGQPQAPYAVVLDEAQWQRKLDALMSYDHIAPYAGIAEPSEKWEALLHRYAEVEGIDLKREPYEWVRQ